MLFENKNVHYPPARFKAGSLGLFGNKSQYSTKKHNQSGRSMIEMLGVLAIVGVLSAGGIAGYSMAMQNYKTNQLINKMQMIATRVRTTYKGNYNGVKRDNMISSGKLSESDFQNPFGGSMRVSHSTNDAFWVFSSLEEEANTPLETCIDILTMDWGEQVDRLQVYNSSGTNTGSFFSSPVALDAATTACSGGDKMVQLRFR